MREERLDRGGGSAFSAAEERAGLELDGDAVAEAGGEAGAPLEVEDGKGDRPGAGLVADEPVRSVGRRARVAVRDDLGLAAERAVEGERLEERLAEGRDGPERAVGRDAIRPFAVERRVAPRAGGAERGAEGGARAAEDREVVGVRVDLCARESPKRSWGQRSTSRRTPGRDEPVAATERAVDKKGAERHGPSHGLLVGAAVPRRPEDVAARAGGLEGRRHKVVVCGRVRRPEPMEDDDPVRRRDGEGRRPVVRQEVRQQRALAVVRRRRRRKEDRRRRRRRPRRRLYGRASRPPTFWFLSFFARYGTARYHARSPSTRRRTAEAARARARATSWGLPWESQDFRASLVNNR